MAEIIQDAPEYEQLEIDFDDGNSAEGVEIAAELAHSPAYIELAAERDATYGRGRSGSRAIARAAFAALRSGEITAEEYAMLFPVKGEDGARTPVVPDVPFEELLTERPPRELDWMELAAGGEADRRRDENV